MFLYQTVDLEHEFFSKIIYNSELCYRHLLCILKCILTLKYAELFKMNGQGNRA